MIQLDEKTPLPSAEPPMYNPAQGTLYPPQPSPGGAYAPPLASPQGYAGSPPLSPQQQMPMQQLSPAAMEAQLGSQYQQQLMARCARGDHEVQKKYGPCGIITAVLLFPIGLICLFMDVDKKCSRCGVALH